MKTYDLGKGLRNGTAAPQDSKPDTVEHDMGCPVAAARLIKKMRKCGLGAAATATSSTRGAPQYASPDGTLCPGLPQRVTSDSRHRGPVISGVAGER